MGEQGLHCEIVASYYVYQPILVANHSYVDSVSFTVIIILCIIMWGIPHRPPVRYTCTIGLCHTVFIIIYYIDATITEYTIIIMLEYKPGVIFFSWLHERIQHSLFRISFCNLYSLLIYQN